MSEYEASWLKTSAHPQVLMSLVIEDGQAETPMQTRASKYGETRAEKW